VKRISTQLPSGDVLPLLTEFERLSFHTAVVNWPDVRGGAARVIGEDAIRTPANANGGAAAQRFNGTGRARQRILYGLTTDAGALSALRAVASQHFYQLDVVALDGFSEAQRALHIWSNDLPPRTSMKGEAVRAYVEQLDRMLGELASGYRDHLIVVVSPSGPDPPALPTTPWSVVRDWVVAEDPGADDGFVLVTDAGSGHRDNPRSAFAADVVPTVLFAAGLPVGRDMDGRVLTDAFADDFLQRNPLSVIPTYEAKQIIVRSVAVP
jgi:hypothetical protein